MMIGLRFCGEEEFLDKFVNIVLDRHMFLKSGEHLQNQTFKDQNPSLIGFCR